MRSDNKKKNIRLIYPLIDNALDYLVHAAEHVSQDSTRSWKYAVLHLISGIELLLKARLEKEHWSLVVKDVDKCSINKYDCGDFVSVDFSESIYRLQNITSVYFTPENNKHVGDLIILRNKLQHFGVNIEVAQVKSLLAINLNFALSFFENNIKEDKDDYDNEIIKEIIEYSSQFGEFVKKRLEEIKPRIPAGCEIIDCPNCSQETLAMNYDGTLKCYFCGSIIDAEGLARQKSEGEVRDCPECGYKSLACIVYNNDSSGWKCFACGTEFDNVNTCSDCGKTFSGDSPMCDDCMSHYINEE